MTLAHSVRASICMQMQYLSPGLLLDEKCPIVHDIRSTVERAYTCASFVTDRLLLLIHTNNGHIRRIIRAFL